MNKDKETILKDVRVLLDEQRENAALIEDEDPISVETDTILWSYVTQAVDEVHLSAQSWMVAPVSVSSDIALSDYRKGKKGSLPVDFLRMIKLSAEDLNADVYEPISEDSDEYLQQQSKWAGVRGNADRPVAAILPNHTGENSGLALEVYGTKLSSCNLLYIKRATVSDDAIDIAPMCYRSVLYTMAKHYLLTIGDSEKAALFGLTAGGLVGASQPVESQA